MYIGAVTISPSPRAAVCRVGDRLEITCNITGRIVMWNLAVIGTTNISRTLSTTTVNQAIVQINSTTLIFSRVSELEALIATDINISHYCIEPGSEWNKDNLYGTGYSIHGNNFNLHLWR